MRKRLDLYARIQAQMADPRQGDGSRRRARDHRRPRRPRQRGDGASPPRRRAPARGAGDQDDDPAVPRRDRRRPEPVHRRAARARDARCARRPRAARGRSRRRASRPPTRSSTPRSSGSPNRSRRSPPSCGRISNGGVFSRRYALTSHEARPCRSSSTTPTVVDEAGNTVDLSLPEPEPAPRSTEDDDSRSTDSKPEEEPES